LAIAPIIPELTIRELEMIKRTIEISRNPAHLSVRLNQLLIQPHDGGGKSASIPCEDIGFLVVDHRQTTYSHNALAKVSEYGGVLVVCGQDHMPVSILLPIADHTQVVWRIKDQIAVSKPLQKQLWQQLVRAKVRAQAANLDFESSESRRLRAMARQVRSGDTGNAESQAARIYWKAWAPDNSFCRNPNGKDTLNSMLNYGYAIIRAAVARSLVASGLIPALGLHHHNRSNAFCLADDLMEPIRPLIDRRVRELYSTEHRRTLDQPTKAALLQVLAAAVTVSGESGPLMVAIHRMTSSLVRCFQGNAREIVIPIDLDRNEQSPC